MSSSQQLTICYLYPDLMNTYGDRGNVLALQQRISWRGIEATVLYHSLGDKLETGKTDIYIFGGGQDRAQIAVSHDLQQKKNELKQDIENGVAALAICGGFQLFGNYYLDPHGVEIKGIGIFDLITKASDKRMIGNLLVTTTGCMAGTTLIGFENHSGQTILADNTPAFAAVEKGFGNNGEDKTEGAIYKNAIGTYMHGSLLPKNPKLTDYIIQKALERKYGPTTISPLDDTLETQAFAEANTRFNNNT
ncbi:MAG: glutamine amidotransferase [bacterium]